MKTEPKFILYLEQILAVAVPSSRYSKTRLYKLRAQLEKEKRFRGRAELHRIIDLVSDYLP
ncbi:hypothetical protein QQ056_17635 [Oscillatoria laete-virens NRMC-F 0139]|nr:hypothetical protein [Oscillatoria laete-virens]MDL5055356.1 hypothetical protein [Oscillatoria laete-virens NRMC-F 0139]